MAETLAARLQDAGELRSVRVGVGVVLPRPADLLRAASVCALVEAYQAAEQALATASLHDDVGSEYTAYQTAKAALLKANLG